MLVSNEIMLEEWYHWKRFDKKVIWTLYVQNVHPDRLKA